MKEFDDGFIDIFNGLYPDIAYMKTSVGVSECHNIEPIEDDYILHTAVIDLNSTSYDWGNPGTYIDTWLDTSSDLWANNQEDVWMDI